jgi:exodeoxyribonuclease VII large subunit
MAEAAPANPGSSANLPEFSVGELSHALKRTVENAFGLVRVRGELSGFKRAASGHLYFALKDEEALIDGVCWRSAAARLRFRPEDGLEVICTGRLTTYPGRSKYQLLVERMEPAGIGALLAQLEERRKRLAAEGLFDASRKRPLPHMPAVIGVVTSPTGAVIRDILHRLRERCACRVIVWPVPVQGDTAAALVAAAIDGFNALPPDGRVPRPDLLIVARGGGSLEDLWAFNEEIVVRAAAASRIPLIAAIGHETDSTLIDFAADKRAPTPTAAAELAVPVRVELLARVTDLSGRLTKAAQRVLDSRRELIAALARGLRHPRDVIGGKQQRLDDLTARLSPAVLHALGARHERIGGLARRLRHPRDLIGAKLLRLTDIAARLGPALIAAVRLRGGQLDKIAGGLRPAMISRHISNETAHLQRVAPRLDPALQRRLADARKALDASAKLLESLSYERVLDRGYAVVRRRDGTTVTSATALRAGTPIEIELKDGKAPAIVDGVRPKRREPTDGNQGQLI